MWIYRRFCRTSCKQKQSNRDARKTGNEKSVDDRNGNLQQVKYFSQVKSRHTFIFF